MPRIRDRAGDSCNRDAALTCSFRQCGPLDITLRMQEEQTTTTILRTIATLEAALPRELIRHPNYSNPGVEVAFITLQVKVYIVLSYLFYFPQPTNPVPSASYAKARLLLRARWVLMDKEQMSRITSEIPIGEIAYKIFALS
jgi:hypothetical protein